MDFITISKSAQEFYQRICSKENWVDQTLNMILIHTPIVFVCFQKKNTVVQYNRKLPEAFWTDYSHQTTNPWNHFASESSKSILSHWAKHKFENPAQKCRKLKTSDRGASKYCHGFQFGWVNFENDCHQDSKRSERLVYTGKSRDCQSGGAPEGPYDELVPINSDYWTCIFGILRT